MKLTDGSAFSMSDIAFQLRHDPLAMLIAGLAGLRILQERGSDASVIAQARVLVASLLHVGRYLEVAVDLASWLAEKTGEERDQQLLRQAEAVRAGQPSPW